MGPDDYYGGERDYPGCRPPPDKWGPLVLAVIVLVVIAAAAFAGEIGAGAAILAAGHIEDYDDDYDDEEAYLRSPAGRESTAFMNRVMVVGLVAFIVAMFAAVVAFPAHGAELAPIHACRGMCSLPIFTTGGIAAFVALMTWRMW